MTRPSSTVLIASVACVLVAACGCDFESAAELGAHLGSGEPLIEAEFTEWEEQSLAVARAEFETQIVSTSAEPATRPDQPPAELELIQYPSDVGPLWAYLTPDPGDGQRHPAILWITGGDNNSIGNVWGSRDRSNDQTAQQFRNAGVVTMYPSQRGGNDNPSQREGFYGEVDDILAAADYLAALPYVDPDRIYLGGHSSGGLLALLTAESTERFHAVFSLGPVSHASHYGGDLVYCDTDDDEEMGLRSPLYWRDDIRTPTLVIEGEDGNWDSIELLADENANPLLRFYKVRGHDHWSVIAPVLEVLAPKVAAGDAFAADDPDLRKMSR